MIKLLLFSFVLLLFVNSMQALNADETKNCLQFGTFSAFKTKLDSLTQIENQVIRDSIINVFWNTLKINHQIPFVLGDSVAFLYKGSCENISWAGDFNGWNPAINSYKGIKVGLSNIWKVEASFPVDARLDYKIVVNGNWILDPANSYIQWSGFGPNSELRMPEWKYPIETIRDPEVIRGSFSNNKIIYSTNLSYTVFYRVYTPADYNSQSNLPVIYVTDGHEYADDRLGSMLIVLDNLIYNQMISPVIAVFVDPRNTANSSQNRRESEYSINEKFADFVADELVVKIDTDYKTAQTPDKRAILGTSLGGINSAYFGIQRSDKFHLISINSPAFKYRPQIYSMYQDSAKLPLRIFMSTGVIHDTETSARQMKQIFESKGYPLKYLEVNEGHSWGNWRALLDEALIYFFPFETNVRKTENSIPTQSSFFLGNYPNPFNSVTNINFFLSIPQNVKLEIFNILGKKVSSISPGEKLTSGYYSFEVNATEWVSGVYFYRMLLEGENFFGKMVFVR